VLEFRIRPATVADAPALGRLHRECWLETYTGVLSDRFLAAASADALADEWAGMLDGVLGDRPAYAWIVTANERARRFYEKHGFALDGLGHPYAPWDDAHCSRMVR